MEKDLLQIIESCHQCLGWKGTKSCYDCAYQEDDDCENKLAEDIIYQLKRLKKLEKPLPKEQPELPGIQ